MRFAPNLHGHKCEQALAFLDSVHVVDQALMGAQIRQDRAPKGGLQRALEGILEDYACRPCCRFGRRS